MGSTAEGETFVRDDQSSYRKAVGFSSNISQLNKIAQRLKGNSKMKIT